MREGDVRKIRTTIYLDINLKNIIELKNINLSELINDLLYKYFSDDTEQIIRKIQQHEQEIIKLKALLQLKQKKKISLTEIKIKDLFNKIIEGIKNKYKKIDEKEIKEKAKIFAREQAEEYVKQLRENPPRWRNFPYTEEELKNNYDRIYRLKYESYINKYKKKNTPEDIIQFLQKNFSKQINELKKLMGKDIDEIYITIFERVYEEDKQVFEQIKKHAEDTQTLILLQYFQELQNY